MQNRIRTAAVVLVAFAASLGIAPSAHAQDRRPCVSKVEFQFVANWTRAEVEERWEVAGLGKHRVIIAVGPGWIYPRCGYSMDEAWYAIAYADGRAYWKLQWKDRDATFHGHL